MKKTFPEKFRITPEIAHRVRVPLQLASTHEHGGNGVFFVPYIGNILRVIASDGQDAPPELPKWEHVSVSLPNRCPTWDEMCFIKDMFFEPEEAVMQLHPRQSEYVNCHPHTLHLWRPVDVAIPEPPAIYVGPVNGQARSA